MTRRAFTMVEAVVAVAVVALLVALLLPGLRAASGAARTTACTSNLRQLSTACGAYVASNDAMPAAVLYYRDGATTRTVAWDFEQSGGAIRPGPLWSYADTALAVQQCPDFAGPSTWGIDPYTGYNYNTSYLGHEGGQPLVSADGSSVDGWRTARAGVPPTAVRDPSATAVFGDGGWRGGANKFMRAPLNRAEADIALVSAGTQAFRHWGGCTCCAYLDGHVATPSMPQRSPLASAAIERWVTDHPSNGFLSADDSAYGGD